MDSRSFSLLVGQFPRTLPAFHHHVPSHNLISVPGVRRVSNHLDVEDEKIFIKDVDMNNLPFPFYKKFEYEVISNTVFSHGSGRYDEAKKLLIDKRKWEKQARRLRRKTKKANLYLAALKLGFRRRFDPRFCDYLKNFESDPEPDFSAGYNWLYNGGNLTGSSRNGSFYLFHPNVVNGSVNLNVSEMDARDLEKKRESVHHLKGDLPVLGLTCADNVSDVILAARRKKRLDIIRFNGESGLTTNPRSLKCLEGILSGCDFNDDGRRIAIINSKSEVAVTDVEYGGNVYSCNVGPRTSDRGSTPEHQIKFVSGEDALYLMNRREVYMMDLRVQSEEPKRVFDPEAVVSADCEVLCSMVSSCFSPHTYYVVTSHNVMQVDLRAKKCIQRWSHLMKSTPQFSMSCRSGNYDLVVVQSGDPEEMIGIVSPINEDDSDPVSRSVPRALSTVKDGLLLANYRGVGLYPGVRERCGYTTTGLHAQADISGDVHIFTVNGGYDVFRTKVRDREKPKARPGEEFEKAMEEFKRFEEHILKMRSEEVHQADDIFHYPELGDGSEEHVDEPELHKSKCDWKYSEMFSPKSLRYWTRDAERTILGVWGVAERTFECEFHDDDVYDESLKPHTDECVERFRGEEDLVNYLFPPPADDESEAKEAKRKKCRKKRKKEPGKTQPKSSRLRRSGLVGLT